MSIWGDIKSAYTHVAMPWTNYQNPQNKANRYLDQIPAQLHQFYDPYAQQGRDLSGQLQQQYGQMAQDPNQVLSRIGAGYQQSPGYQYMYNEAMRGAGNQAAAGGYTGTPEDEQFRMQTASGLANQDYYNYLSNALGMQTQGLVGEQGLETQGYGAGESLAQSLSNLLTGKAGMAYQSAAQRNQAINSILAALMKGGATYAGGSGIAGALKSTVT